MARLNSAKLAIWRGRSVRPAPIFNGEELILGSVGVSWQKEEMPDVDLRKTIVTVKRAAREITTRISASTSKMGLPPRAVG